MRCVVLAVALLLSFPACAQTAPDLDEDGCIALAAKMDTAAKAKQKPTEKEQSDSGECVSWFNCEKARNADDATAQAAAATNESLMRFVLKTCADYEPPQE